MLRDDLLSSGDIRSQVCDKIGLSFLRPCDERVSIGNVMTKSCNRFVPSRRVAKNEIDC